MKQKKKPQQSVFAEARENMSADIDRLLPQKLRGLNKKKYAVILTIVELIVLGLLGKLVYNWLAG